MWFVGLLAGLLAGAMFQSVAAALVLGALGAVVVPLIAKKDKGDASAVGAPESDPMGESELTSLQQRVSVLERKLVTLEAKLLSGTAPLSMAVSPAQSQPEQRSEQKEQAVGPNVPVFRPLPKVSRALAVDASAAILVPAQRPISAASPEHSFPRISVPPTTSTPAPLPASRLVVASTQPMASPVPPVVAQPPVQLQRPAPPPPLPPPPPPPPPPAVPLRDRLPAPLRNLIFGGNMLVKLGVLILFLGLAFLLRYTAERVTVPVELRYAGVALAGAALLALGWFLRRKRAGYALILQGAGIGVFYLTTLAAMKVHELLPPMMGFGFLFAVAVLSAVLAVAQNAPVLAIVAALEGFAAPMLASTGSNNAIGLFSYLLVLDVGIFLVAWFKAWRLLNLIGAVGTFMLASGWSQRYYTLDQYGTVQVFLIVFFVLFALIGLLFARRTLFEAPPDDQLPLAERAVATLRRVGRVDSALVFGVPMAAFGLQYLMARQWEFGAAFSALGFGAFYLSLGWIVVSSQPRGLRLLAEAYAIVGVIFATLAIPLGLEGQWTGATWAIEAAGMYWLGVRQSRPYARGFSLVLLAGSVVQLLRSMSFDGEAGHPLLHGSSLGALMVAGGVFVVLMLLRRARLHETASWESRAGSVLPWVGTAALTLLPFMLLTPHWAAVAVGLLALAAYAFALRASMVSFRMIAFSLQLLVVVVFATSLQIGADGEPLLDGSVGAAICIACGLFAMWTLCRRSSKSDGRGQDNWETIASVALPWAAMAVFTTVPWLTLPLLWAPAAAALLALLCFAVGARWVVPPLRPIAHAIQGLAVVTLIVGLHPNRDTGGALASGWQGTVGAGLVAFSLLATAAWAMRRAHREALMAGVPPRWSMVQVVTLLAGVSLLHLAMLFGVDLPHAALIWPFTAAVVLWLALRMAHRPLAMLAALLHLAAAVFFLIEAPSWSEPRPAFAHLGFWTPLALGLTALVAADWLRAQARYSALTKANGATAPVERWVNDWCAQPVVLWISLLWGVWWWFVATLGESVRVLDDQSQWDRVPAAVVGVMLLSSVVASVVAARRDWRHLGQITVITLPAFVASALIGVVQGATPPSIGFGWLAWPLAFLWHLRLLHAQRRWLATRMQQVLHAAGLWFFILLAARECQWQLGRIGDVYSSWPLLGWVVAPVLVLWALRSRTLLARWPLTEHRNLYLEFALKPVAIFLLCWCWVTNVVSAGDALPLPFVPLLNPLELGQWLVLAALVLWWKALPADADLRVLPSMSKGIAALTAWALLTGAVLRACHHYANVAWNLDALYMSTLTQAALSIVWGICGVLAMVLGNRRGKRVVWVAGVALLGVVVLKLFFVELANQGSLFRIVSFIGVGTLLLLVGYFAPVPTSRRVIQNEIAA